MPNIKPAKPGRIRRSVSFLPENLEYLEIQAAKSRRSVNFLVNAIVEGHRKTGRNIKA